MRRERGILAFFIVLGVLGLAMILVGTSRYGPGMTTVSGDYVSAARNLMAGEGYLQYDGEPYVFYPPLFPSLLALIGVTGADVIDVARYLNAIFFGLIVFLSGLWLARGVRFLPLVLLGTIVVLLSQPLLRVSVRAWTEPLFVVLVMLFLFAMERHLERADKSSFYMAILWAALGTLTRYAGVAMILTGAILIVLGGQAGRYRRGLVFVIMSSLPTVVWLIRNYILTSTVAGVRGESPFGVGENIYYTLNIFSIWFLPPKIAAGPRIAAFVLGVLVIVGWMLWAARRRGSDTVPHVEWRSVLPMGLFVVVYTTLMVIVASLSANDRLGTRYLMPVFVPLWLFVVYAIDRIRAYPYPRISARAMNTIAAVVLLVWAGYGLRTTIRSVRGYVRDGAGGYSQTVWRTSEVIRYLKAHPLQGDVYTNEAYALHILTGLRPKLSPRRYLFNSPGATTDELAQFGNAASGGEKTYLVWFEGVNREYLHSLEELGSVCTLEAVESLSDGAIYEVR